MEAQQERLYQAKEFARRAGVTVRTLHFYDRLGLLKPSARTPSGYRLYGDAQLERLEQIMALRFVGLPLHRIKQLLSGSPHGLHAALTLQRAIVAEQQQRLHVALQAIDAARDLIAREHDDEQRWRAIRRVIEALKMNEDYRWTEKYYTAEDNAKIAEHRERLGDAAIKRAEADWAQLIAEVEAAAQRGDDPSSEHAQSLNRRWCELVAGFTQNDPGIEAGLKKLYNDEANWPKTFKRPWSDEAQAFLDRVRAAKATA